jgi:CheY-like chemotaxis protein
MNGYDVARSMRADHTLKGTLLIAVSGYTRAEDIRLGTEAGFDKHLAKPPRLDKLERMIAEAPEPLHEGDSVQDRLH